MKISEIIEALECHRELHGDIECRTFEMTDCCGGEYLAVTQVIYNEPELGDGEFVSVEGGSELQAQENLRLKAEIKRLQECVRVLERERVAIPAHRESDGWSEGGW